MPAAVRVVRDCYRDSVSLMLLADRLQALPGIAAASALMGTPANVELLVAAGADAAALACARPGDLCVIFEGPADALATAGRLVDQWIASGDRPRAAVVGTQEAGARSLSGALALDPAANLALISVPGEYAAREARRALWAGLHVMLFSDNVPLDEEVALKRLAAARGLLCLGPDCGTALIAGAPLGLANAVRRGGIGIVGPSGTGIQEVSSLIDRLGKGVSHALGTGSRDLSAEVGGLGTLSALDLLAQDAATRVLVLVAKPGDAGVQRSVLERAAAPGRPCVACLLGTDGDAGWPSGVRYATTLEDATRLAVALARGEEGAQEGGPFLAPPPLGEGLEKGAPLVGLFTGGTLAWEAALLLGQALGVPPRAETEGVVWRVGRHRIVDLGDDHYTRGRPHPILAPERRNEAIRAAGEVGLLLLDVPLGFGAHPDPAGALAPVLAELGCPVLASVTGTEADPQGYSQQVATLRGAGARVYPSSTAAARAAAAWLAGGRG